MTFVVEIRWDELTELHVVKHKNGPTDTLHFTFDGAYQRFTDWEGPPPSKGFGKTRSSGGLD